MEEYRIPAGEGRSEFTEKRSRFLSLVLPVEGEAQARAAVEAMKKQHHDARHNCWCYSIRDTGAVRYSDDGEPQGTAGQPMLAVFQRAGVDNFCCVVTRYFGGVLLGAGGLTRAYARAAKDGLDAAGLAVMRPWTRVEVPCPYHLLERVRLTCEAWGGLWEGAEYGVGVTVTLLLPAAAVEPFACRITEWSAGSVPVTRVGEVIRGEPAENVNNS